MMPGERSGHDARLPIGCRGQDPILRHCRVSRALARLFQAPPGNGLHHQPPTLRSDRWRLRRHHPDSLRDRRESSSACSLRIQGKRLQPATRWTVPHMADHQLGRAFPSDAVQGIGRCRSIAHIDAIGCDCSIATPWPLLRLLHLQPVNPTQGGRIAAIVLRCDPHDGVLLPEWIRSSTTPLRC